MNNEKIMVEGKLIPISKPTECYYCDKGINPKIVNSFFYSYYNYCFAYIAFQCPCCDQVFFAKYQVPDYDLRNDPFYLHYSEVIGGHARSIDFPDEIKELSDDFVKNFNDSYTAEQSGCTEIVGIGYRKAFEFLMKDFAIKYNPNDKERIISMNLSQCVNEYSPDEDIKQLLERTTWIGNDYAHYKKNHSDITLDDLRELVLLAANSIYIYVRKKKYIKKIEKK